jgi:tetratricopeptide (TPR) repeat protein
MKPNLAVWGRVLCAAVLAFSAAAIASPYVPKQDGEVLASLPAGIAHTSNAVRRQAAARLDVALPLAQFYISQARATGDLRFLGYADGVLQNWRGQTPTLPAVLVLHATILQSRHAFDASLAELDQALQAEPGNFQAWLTRATVLRVLGRYDEAARSCERLRGADPAIAELCLQSLRGVSGHLPSAYAAIISLPEGSLANAARAWRYSELGEMAASMDQVGEAEHWYQKALQLTPDDNYTRAAYADLLLSERRALDTLKLLKGYESMEPMLLRIALAQQQLHDPNLSQSRRSLASAFDVEERRGEAVHRREQARFLLDIAHEPEAALASALENWRVQREAADALILLRAARAAQRPEAAAPAVQFVREHGMEDARIAP